MLWTFGRPDWFFPVTVTTTILIIRKFPHSIYFQITGGSGCIKRSKQFVFANLTTSKIQGTNISTCFQDNLLVYPAERGSLTTRHLVDRHNSKRDNQVRQCWRATNKSAGAFKNLQQVLKNLESQWSFSGKLSINFSIKFDASYFYITLQLPSNGHHQMSNFTYRDNRNNLYRKFTSCIILNFEIMETQPGSSSLSQRVWESPTFSKTWTELPIQVACSISYRTMYHNFPPDHVTGSNDTPTKVIYSVLPNVHFFWTRFVTNYFWRHPGNRTSETHLRTDFIPFATRTEIADFHDFTLTD